MRLFVVAGAVAGAAALAASGPASAGCGGNLRGGGPPSVQQYVEQIPTPCGSHPSGSGTRKTKLPNAIQKKLESQGGSQATLLENVATSEKYGAPQTTKKNKLSRNRKPVKPGGKTERISAAIQNRNPLSASVSVVTDGSDGRLIALVVLMAAMAVLVLGAAVYRRRAGR